MPAASPPSKGNTRFKVPAGLMLLLLARQRLLALPLPLRPEVLLRLLKT